MIDRDPIEPNTWRQKFAITAMLSTLFFIYAGDAPPMVNEAHYMVKAKNFWQPTWCVNDLFASSGKAHTTFYVLFGWPLQRLSLETTTWIGRIVGWMLIAIGLRRLCNQLFRVWWSSIVVAVIWIAGVYYGNFAGEWVVGGIEAKVPAYGLVLMGLAELVQRRWNRVWVYLGAASAFHVLTGGWSVVAAMIAWTLTEARRDDRHPLFTRWLFVGGALSLFGLLPAVWLTMGSDPAESAAAARIYSYFRIRHHLLPADFLPIWYLRHGVVLVFTAAGIWIYRSRSDAMRPLIAFTIGAVVIAATGLFVGALPAFAPELAAKLLRFYWFRLSDAVVPLMLAILVTRWMLESHRLRQSFGFAVLFVAIGLVGYSTWDRMRIGVPPSVSNRLLGWDAGADAIQQRQVFADWLRVCEWAKLSTPENEVFLTPRHQQTFKWYASRAEVVNWKDVPQDATSLIEWNDRFAGVFPIRLGTIRVTINYDTLRRYRDEYGVRFMIVDRRVVGQQLPLVRVYPQASDDNRNYAVYELPR